MAYENIDVTSARNSINNCLNSLTHSTSDNFLSTLPSSTNWVADSKDTFVAAINKLVNVRYKELEDYLKQCLTSLDYISKIQELQAQNKKNVSIILADQIELETQKTKYNGYEDKSTAEAKKVKARIDSLEKEIANKKKENDNNTTNINSYNKNVVL